QRLGLAPVGRGRADYEATLNLQDVNAPKAVEIEVPADRPQAILVRQPHQRLIDAGRDDLSRQDLVDPAGDLELADQTGHGDLIAAADRHVVDDVGVEGGHGDAIRAGPRNHDHRQVRAVLADVEQQVQPGALARQLVGEHADIAGAQV